MAQRCKYCHSAVVTSLMTCPFCGNPLEIEDVNDEDVQPFKPPEKPVSVPYGASNGLQAAGYLPGTMPPPASGNGTPPSPKETPLPPSTIIPPPNIPDPTFAPEPSWASLPALPPPTSTPPR